MKVGNKHQAIILGVIAFLALGMVTKTALGSLPRGNSNQPIPVQDLGGVATTPHDENPAPESSKSGQTTKRPIHDLTTPSINSAVVVRDAFSKPNLPEKTQSWPKKNQHFPGNEETQVQTKPENPFEGSVEVGKIGPLPKNQAGPGQEVSKKEIVKDPPKKPLVGIRYTGYVEAGSPMAIVLVNGENLSLQVGSKFGDGFTVESITDEHITIRKGKLVKTVLIGKEIQF